jgi:hypothetical protein
VDSENKEKHKKKNRNDQHLNSEMLTNYTLRIYGQLEFLIIAPIECHYTDHYFEYQTKSKW